MIMPGIPEPAAWNPLVKIFVIGMMAGAFIGTFMALLMEYGGGPYGD
jgi:hypothetical protein